MATATFARIVPMTEREQERAAIVVYLREQHDMRLRLYNEGIAP